MKNVIILSDLSQLNDWLSHLTCKFQLTITVSIFDSNSILAFKLDQLQWMTISFSWFKGDIGVCNIQSVELKVKSILILTRLRKKDDRASYEYSWQMIFDWHCWSYHAISRYHSESNCNCARSHLQNLLFLRTMLNETQLTVHMSLKT